MKSPGTIRETAVRVELENVSVEFPVLNVDSQSLRAQFLHHGSAGFLKRGAGRKVNVLALDQVNFTARNGDRIGLIGRNGAGKSTLLRVIAGIHAPGSGRARVEGSVSALLGGGVGVDEELTGFEAIQYGGMLLGLSAQRMRDLTPEIADFAELGDYLSIPVRTYSAGMKVRLHFAIATCHQPDILLIDEGIGAGDAHFVDKAKRRAMAFMGSSTVTILASHSLDILRAVCNKAILLDGGRVVIGGDIEEVLTYYMEAEQSSAAVSGPITGHNISEISYPCALSTGDSDGCSSAMAFDDCFDTHWLSAQAGCDISGVASIGLDYGPEKKVEIRQFALRQWSGGTDPNLVSAVQVQASDDGFVEDIRDVGRISVAPTIGRSAYEVLASRPARQWRLVAATPTQGGPWGVIELDFVDSDSVAQESADLGRALSSGHMASHAPANAFNFRADSMWVSAERGPEVVGRSYLGYDFGPGNAQAVRRFVIRQWDGGARPNTVARVRLESSDDRFESDIRLSEVIVIGHGTRRCLYHCPASDAARYWRLIADEPTGGGCWGIVDFEVSPQPEPELGQDQPPTAIGNAISSGEVPGFASSYVFDGSMGTHWQSPLPGQDLKHMAFIGYNFGDKNMVQPTRILVQQWNSGLPPNMIRSVVVQGSNDLFDEDVRTVATLSLHRNSMRQTYEIDTAEAASGWRLLANDTTAPDNGPWGVVNVEIWDASGRRAGATPDLDGFGHE